MRTQLRPPLLRSGTLAIALLVAALTVRCGDVSYSSSDGGTPPPGDGDSGCTGTTGELGRVRFIPEEDPWADVSASAGTRAFAAGTVEPFRVETATDAPLPALLIQSLDAEVLTVRDAPEGPYPHDLVLGSPGTATIQMVRQDDLTLWDRVDLDVREPGGFALWASPLASEPIFMAEQVAEPDAVVLAPDGRLRVAFALTDGAGMTLLGNYVPALTTDASLVVVDGGRVSVGDDVYVAAHLATVIATGAAGPFALAIGGPGEARRTLEVQVVAAPELTGLTVCLDGALSGSFTAGTEQEIGAYGQTVDGLAAFGYAVRYVSSDPRVVELLPGEAPDAARVRFGTAGKAVLTAYLDADPRVNGSLEVEVAPAE